MNNILCSTCKQLLCNCTIGTARYNLFMQEQFNKIEEKLDLILSFLKNKNSQ